MINFMGASACPLCKPRLMHLGIEKLSQLCQPPSSLNEASMYVNTEKCSVAPSYYSTCSTNIEDGPLCAYM